MPNFGSKLDDTKVTEIKKKNTNKLRLNSVKFSMKI